MVIFGVAALVMVAVALALVIPAVAVVRAGRGPTHGDVQRALYREKLAELETQRETGALDEPGFREARRELDREFLEDASEEAGGAASAATHAHPFRAAIIAVLIPVSATGIYLATGTPGVLVDESLLTPGGADAGAPPDIATMVASLEARLNRAPDDAEGWVMLARSYQVMRRPEDARRVLEQALTHHPDDPVLLVHLAEVVATRNGNRLDGRPMELVRRALERAPDFPRALWLAGIDALNRGDAEGALVHWERVLEVAEMEPGARAQIEQAIADARARASGDGAVTPPATPDAPASIEVTVTVADAFANRVDGSESLYVFARAVDGPPMPLAVKRLTTDALPVTLTLDDSLAMAPGLALSDHDPVVITARISRTGTPQARAGDLEGVSAPVSPGERPQVTLVIDRAVE